MTRILLLMSLASLNLWTSASALAPHTPPKISYWHVWTDDKGISHQTRCELSNFVLKGMTKKIQPQWQNKMSGDPHAMIFTVQPVGWIGKWHENPQPQWLIPLVGRLFVETMDHKRVEMGPGEISFGEDQKTKEDREHHQGHLSGTLGDQPVSLIVVQGVASPDPHHPCGFK